jgi:ABC-type transport system substrate-binding protein
VINWAGPWGTGPYQLVEGASTPTTRSDRIVLEANLSYWDHTRMPKLRRIIFDNTLEQHLAVAQVKTDEGRVDIVTDLRPLETLRVAQSPFAKVVKVRGSWKSVFGLFNMRKTESSWRDVRLRQAANLAINREDLIRYTAKGNGVILPALLPVGGFGYDSDLTPYPFDPSKARVLLREAGYPDGLAVTLITTDDLDQPPTHQAWDIALTSFFDIENFSIYHLYHHFALDGFSDWLLEEPELQRFYHTVLGTVDRERQEGFVRQMERHTQDQAYFLFLYNPIQLYAVNKAVEFVPYVNTLLKLDTTAVSEQHWSVRKQKAAVQQ